MWNTFVEQFNQNFIEDARWAFLLKGLGNTLLITVFAVMIGIVLGFLIAVVRSTHDKTGSMKFLNAICRIYLTVIRGTPVIVQLMILYYVIFAAVDINKILV